MSDDVRMRSNEIRWPSGDDRALSQDVDVVGNVENEAEVVLHDHYRGPRIRKSANDGPQLHELVLIHPSGRLVEEYDPWPCGQGARNLEHSSSSEGEGMGGLKRDMAETEALQCFG